MEEIFKKEVEKYIIENNKIPEDLKNEWRVLLSKDFIMMSLRIREINKFKDYYNKIELETIYNLGNLDNETEFVLECYKVNLFLDLHRTLVQESEYKRGNTRNLLASTTCVPFTKRQIIKESGHLNNIYLFIKNIFHKQESS